MGMSTNGVAPLEGQTVRPPPDSSRSRTLLALLTRPLQRDALRPAGVDLYHDFASGVRDQMVERGRRVTGSSAAVAGSSGRKVHQRLDAGGSARTRRPARRSSRWCGPCVGGKPNATVVRSRSTRVPARADRVRRFREDGPPTSNRGPHRLAGNSGSRRRTGPARSPSVSQRARPHRCGSSTASPGSSASPCRAPGVISLISSAGSSRRAWPPERHPLPTP